MWYIILQHWRARSEGPAEEPASWLIFCARNIENGLAVSISSFMIIVSSSSSSSRS